MELRITETRARQRQASPIPVLGAHLKSKGGDIARTTLCAAVFVFLSGD